MGREFARTSDMSDKNKGKSWSKTYSSKANAIDNHIVGNAELPKHKIDKVMEAYYNGPPLTKKELEWQDKAFARSQRQLPRESLTEEESLRLMAWSEKFMTKRKPFAIQGKFEISDQHDASEKQADKIADQVIGLEPPYRNGDCRSLKIPNQDRIQRQKLYEEEDLQLKSLNNSPIQRQVEEEEEETLNLKSITENSLSRQTDEEENKEDLYRKKLSDEVSRLQESTSSSGIQVSPQVESGIKSMKGQGQSLSDSERSFFEPRFGRDFSGVKIHNNANAAELADSIRAKAFTIGNDIFFNQGQYQPSIPEGKKLMAHELTHVVQQNHDSVILKSRESKSNTIFRHTEKSNMKYDIKDTGKQTSKVKEGSWYYPKGPYENADTAKIQFFIAPLFVVSEGDKHTQVSHQDIVIHIYHDTYKKDSEGVPGKRLNKLGLSRGITLRFVWDHPDNKLILPGAKLFILEDEVSKHLPQLRDFGSLAVDFHVQKAWYDKKEKAKGYKVHLSLSYVSNTTTESTSAHTVGGELGFELKVVSGGGNYTYNSQESTKTKPSAITHYYSYDFLVSY